jgi:hypothetical protein
MAKQGLSPENTNEDLQDVQNPAMHLLEAPTANSLQRCLDRVVIQIPDKCEATLYVQEVRAHNFLALPDLASFIQGVMRMLTV